MTLDDRYTVVRMPALSTAGGAIPGGPFPKGSTLPYGVCSSQALVLALVASMNLVDGRRIACDRRFLVGSGRFQ